MPNDPFGEALVSDGIARTGHPVVGFIGVALLFLTVFATTGCDDRNLAPHVEYSPSEVETLSREIENMDWD